MLVDAQFRAVSGLLEGVEDVEKWQACIVVSLEAVLKSEIRSSQAVKALLRAPR